MEARVAVSSRGAVVDGGPRKFLQQQQQQQLHHSQPPISPGQQHQIGTVPQLLAGGIAGAFSKTCTAPLARLTILFQVQGMHSNAAVLTKTSLWGEALRIVNEEGFRAFWKGNLVTIVHRLPYSSVNFYAYERYKSLLKSIPGLESHNRSAHTDNFVHFIGGGLAGMTAASMTYPLDLVRTRLAAQWKVSLSIKFHFWYRPAHALSFSSLSFSLAHLVLILQRSTIYYRGIWHALHTICRDEGFLGLYKGLGATLLGVGPSIAISFTVYEMLRSYWHSERPDDSTVLVSLACGSLSGVASSTATFPLDLVRRRKQLEGAAGQARMCKTSLLGTFRHIIRSEGLCGLYRGILPEYYKVVPGVGIAFMTYETLKKILSDGPLNS